jgi:7-keto-8-aminopelargonate synthetase-like enzyme
MALCGAALQNGAFAQAIRPPTVPEGSSRLRIVSLASHTEDELRTAADAFAAAAVASAR